MAFQQEQRIVWMDNVRKTVTEILGKVDTEGKVSLGDAKAIADKYNISLALVLSELEQRCRVNYTDGVILCQK